MLGHMLLATRLIHLRAAVGAVGVERVQVSAFGQVRQGVIEHLGIIAGIRLRLDLCQELQSTLVVNCLGHVDHIAHVVFSALAAKGRFQVIR